MVMVDDPIGRPGAQAWEPYILAEITAGGWRDVTDREWELARQADQAHPGDADAQRMWLKAAVSGAGKSDAR